MSNTKDGVRIAKCSCPHEHQDKVYGSQMRVHNNAPSKGAKPNRYRCTVCGNEKDLK